MSIKSRYFILTAALLFGLTASLSASEHSSADKQTPCKVITKSKAVDITQKAIKGRILSASLIKRPSSLIYKVKVLLTNGRVKTILVDGCKARIIKVN